MLPLAIALFSKAAAKFLFKIQVLSIYYIFDPYLLLRTFDALIASVGM